MNEVWVGRGEVGECFFGLFSPTPDDDGLILAVESLPEDFPEGGHPGFPIGGVGIGFKLADGKSLVNKENALLHPIGKVGVRAGNIIVIGEFFKNVGEAGRGFLTVGRDREGESHGFVLVNVGVLADDDDANVGEGKGAEESPDGIGWRENKKVGFIFVAFLLNGVKGLFQKRESNLLEEGNPRRVNLPDDFFHCCHILYCIQYNYLNTNCVVASRFIFSV